MLVELQGQIERITYRNEENHYTVARLKVKGYRSPVTVIGSLVSVSPGEVLRLKGSWDVHPRYGEQFRIISYESVIPATAKGIERYLGSGLIKGIGPVMARRLVDRFGLETLDIIENDIARLREIEGIGDKRIAMIGTAWSEQKEVRQVMLFLQGHEVSSSYAAKIYRQYGQESIKVVTENPYRLASDIFGVGFLTADKIAAKLGIPKDSPQRAEAGIMYVLNKLADDGHVFYPHGTLIEECRNILDIESDTIRGALDKLVGDHRVVTENGAVYLEAYHAAETSIARSLKLIMDTPGKSIQYDVDAAVQQVQQGLGIVLARAQVQAVREAMNSKVLVLTGGPGTGKTTIINAIIRIAANHGQKALLAAPTGRAAKRMTETCGHAAKTIHRLLEFSPREGEFKRNGGYPLDADLIVVDESSMVDTTLMHHLLNAVPGSATLVLVGDVDQLPSVGPGNVLRDIIDSGFVHVTRLNEIFRQSRSSLIILNAHRINNGEMPVFTPGGDAARDFYFFDLDDPEKVREMIIDMCRDRIPGKFGFSPDDIQVLTPMHRGVVGASNLNSELQRHLNPSGDELARGARIFRTGDRVMQIRNNYDKDVYNGDIGKVIAINREEQEVTVEYDGRHVVYDFTDLDEIVLAYAVSVHKSQGSEYPVVVMPLLTQHYMMLQRNLLYTAVTRGKRLVVIIGTRKALAIAIKNNRPQMRYTKLRERLASLKSSS